MPGYKNFVAGEEALASDVNGYLMGQTVARFANATQRSAAITAPALNQLSMLDARPGYVQYWNGSAWVDQAYVPPPIPPETDPRSQYGSNVLMTNVFGGATFPFPVAFGGAPIITAINGDYGSGFIGYAGDGTYTTASQGALVAMSGTGALLGNSTVRANWIAVGPR